MKEPKNPKVVKETPKNLNGSEPERKHSFLTADETNTATVKPISEIGDFAEKNNPRAHFEIDLKDELYSTNSANINYSHLLNNSGKASHMKHVSEFSDKNVSLNQKFKKCKDLIYQSMMGAMPKHKPRHSHTSGSKVFSRLYSQALIKQRKSKMNSTRSKSNRTNRAKSKRKANASKTQREFDIYGRRKAKNTIEFDGSTCHRLYAKSRGLSQKRSKSLRKLRKEKESSSQRELKSLSKTSHMNSHSRWILDKRYLEEKSEATWDK